MSSWIVRCKKEEEEEESFCSLQQWRGVLGLKLTSLTRLVLLPNHLAMFTKFLSKVPWMKNIITTSYFVYRINLVSFLKTISISNSPSSFLSLDKKISKSASNIAKGAKAARIQRNKMVNNLFPPYICICIYIIRSSFTWIYLSDTKERFLFVRIDFWQE